MWILLCLGLSLFFTSCGDGPVRKGPVSYQNSSKEKKSEDLERDSSVSNGESDAEQENLPGPDEEEAPSLKKSQLGWAGDFDLQNRTIQIARLD
tara:strand:+ start:31 stop:312 length:282 start_codon:yes stop_codon:yes gene_type:complete